MEPALMLSPRDGTVPSHELSPVLRPITDGLVDLDGVSTATVWLRTSARDPRLRIGAAAGPFDAHEWEFVRHTLDRRQPFVLGGITAVFPLAARDELVGT